ncbi:MAG: carbohydrate ABC transporter permease [Atopostipes sp.]|nr:carbohydrate ABC transporter permease [Atopostipes sp.]
MAKSLNEKRRHIKEPLSDRIFLFIVHVLLLFALVVTLYPIIYIFSASMSNPSAVNSGEMWLFPIDITWEGYKVLLANNDIWLGYYNTIIYTVVGTAINLLVTIPGAYVLSRKDFQARGFVTKLLIFTMFFSGGLIPSYLLVTGLGLNNTMWALILPGAASVYNVVVTRTFFETNIPDSLTEAAFIDGASDFQIFGRIVLPLSKPILAVMALFYGVGHWNEFFNALIYLDDRKKYPLQMILREILVQQDLSSNPSVGSMTTEQAQFLHSQKELSAILKYGVMIVASVPVIIVYPFIQKYFVQGVMIGSIKG